MNELEKLTELAKFLDEQIEKLKNGNPKEITNHVEAFGALTPQQKDEIAKEVEKFDRRLTIAKALGSRPFVKDGKNYQIELDDRTGEWSVDYYDSYQTKGVDYFETKEQAEKYLEICLKEGLL